MNNGDISVTITIDLDELESLADFGYIDKEVWHNDIVQPEDVTNAIHGIIADLWKMNH